MFLRFISDDIIDNAGSVHLKEKKLLATVKTDLKSEYTVSLKAYTLLASEYTWDALYNKDWDSIREN